MLPDAGLDADIDDPENGDGHEEAVALTSSGPSEEDDEDAAGHALLRTGVATSVVADVLEDWFKAEACAPVAPSSPDSSPDSGTTLRAVSMRAVSMRAVSMVTVALIPPERQLFVCSQRFAYGSTQANLELRVSEACIVVVLSTVRETQVDPQKPSCLLVEEFLLRTGRVSCDCPRWRVPFVPSLYFGTSLEFGVCCAPLERIEEGYENMRRKR